MIESRSPQQPNDLVVLVPDNGIEAVAESVELSRVAAAAWRRLPALARAQALDAAADSLASASTELIDLVVREVGKPLQEAIGEVARTVAIFRYYAQATLDPDGETYPSPDGTAMLMSRRRAHGVAGLITPWNFPVAIPAWKAAPALAYGNGVVLKPAPEASAVAMRLAECCASALPDGLFSVVTGGADTGRAVVETVDAVSFTGSVPAGNTVASAAAARGIPCQAEMGGQNAAIVLCDADVEGVAGVIATAAMGYAGQKCTATSRVVVVGNPAPLTEALVAAVEALIVGNPAMTSTDVGPVITSRARDRVLAATEEARARGGRLLTGGHRGDGEGWFVAPTLIDGLRPDDRIAQEEVFGPICVVLSVPDEATALAVANGVAYGLVTSVFTEDLNRTLSLVEGLDTGLIRINSPTSGVEFYAPFGGTKASSFGPREQGKAAKEFYSTTQTITIALA